TAFGQTATVLAVTGQALSAAPTLTATYLAPAFTQTWLAAAQNQQNTAIARPTQLAAEAAQATLNAAQTQTPIAQTAAAGTRLAAGATGTYSALLNRLHGQIAFVSGQTIYALSLPDLAIRPLTTIAAEHPAWSPDGRRVAFASSLQIYVM